MPKLVFMIFGIFIFYSTRFFLFPARNTRSFLFVHPTFSMITFSPVPVVDLQKNRVFLVLRQNVRSSPSHMPIRLTATIVLRAFFPCAHCAKTMVSRGKTRIPNDRFEQNPPRVNRFSWPYYLRVSWLTNGIVGEIKRTGDEPVELIAKWVVTVGGRSCKAKFYAYHCKKGHKNRS